ncbi:hypothetical protein V1517DRAFT_339530 [Lipomyces orientalis]|uniref:Uncharacterized protein n=1 Tax=Lipomyces orientalis TaxID=1233043 RepID=A0ACC3TLF9_9ASCO
MATDASPQTELRALYSYKPSAETDAASPISGSHTITVPLTSISHQNSTDSNGGHDTLEALASQLPKFQADINAYLTERIERSKADGDREQMEKLERTVLDGDEEEDDEEEEEDE